VRRAWRRLDDETRLSFLAALWAARGFETRVADGRVSADRDGQVDRVVPSAAIGRGTTTPGDVLVTVRRGGDAARPDDGRGADPTGEVRHLTARDLRRVLLYAVDRPDGERLAREYLAVPLTVPDGTSVEGNGRLRRAVDRATRAATPATVAAVVLILAGLAGAVVVGGDASIAGASLGGSEQAADGDAAQQRTPGGDGDGGGSDGMGSMAPSPPEPAANGNTGTGGSNGGGGEGASSDAVGALGATDGSEPGPGLVPGRPISADRLAAAHARAVAGETYGLRVWGTELPATAVADAPPVAGWAERDRPVESALWVFVENGTTYRGYLEASLAGGGGPATAGLRYETYADGGTVWHRRSTGNDWRVWRDPTPVPGADGRDRYARLAAGFVERYLSTTAVVVRERDPDSNLDPDDGAVATASTDRTSREATGYRVVARGEPRALDVVMPSYRAEATVRADGLVTRLEVEYYVRDETADDGGRWVAFGFEYVDAGRGSVSEPEWVREIDGRRGGDGDGGGGASLACTTADVASGLCGAAMDSDGGDSPES
jgi:hypothetical protein